MDDLTDIIIRYRWEIAGALTMAFIIAYLAGINNRLNRLAIASTAFRNTILTELKGLYPIPSDWPKDTNVLDQRLRQVFPNLQIAVVNFRPFVPWYWRWTFDRTWRFYRLGKEGRDIDQQYYGQYQNGESTTVINDVRCL
ncbi:MAG: hypothetical protein WC659_07145 [Patescibacteria group bacterium]